MNADSPKMTIKLIVVFPKKRFQINLADSLIPNKSRLNLIWIFLIKNTPVQHLYDLIWRPYPRRKLRVLRNLPLKHPIGNNQTLHPMEFAKIPIHLLNVLDKFQLVDEVYLCTNLNNVLKEDLLKLID